MSQLVRAELRVWQPAQHVSVAELETILSAGARPLPSPLRSEGHADLDQRHDMMGLCAAVPIKCKSAAPGGSALLLPIQLFLLPHCCHLLPQPGSRHCWSVVLPW